MTQEPDVKGTVFADDSPEVTRSYADALLGAAEKDGDVEAVLGELDELVADLLVGDRRFAALFTSPSIRPAEKDRILASAFEGRALPIIVRFLRVLNNHGRLNLLGPIARHARATWDHRQNRRPVTVRSAVALDDSQKSTLTGRLAAMLAATPIVTYEVDPALIGGLVIQAGDDIYDASVRTQIDQLRRRLIEEKFRDVQGRQAFVTA